MPNSIPPCGDGRNLRLSPDGKHICSDCPDDGTPVDTCCKSNPAIAAQLGQPVNDCGLWVRTDPPDPPVIRFRRYCLLEARAELNITNPGSTQDAFGSFSGVCELVDPVTVETDIIAGGENRGCVVFDRALCRFQMTNVRGAETRAADYEYCGTFRLGCPPIGASATVNYIEPDGGQFFATVGFSVGTVSPFGGNSQEFGVVASFSPVDNVIGLGSTTNRTASWNSDGREMTQTTVTRYFAFLFGQGLAGPIVRLAAALKRFTSGETAVRAEITTQDEVGELATQFNNMAEQVGGFERRATSQQVAVAGAGTQRHLGNPLGHQAALIGAHHAQCDVGFAPQQVGHLVAGHQLHLDPGVLQAQARQHGRQQVAGHRLTRGGAHGPRDHLVGARGGAAGLAGRAAGGPVHPAALGAVHRDRRLGAAVLRTVVGRAAHGERRGHPSGEPRRPRLSPRVRLRPARPAGLTAQSAAAAQQRDRRGDRGFEHSAHRRPVLDGLCGQLAKTADQDDGSRR